MQHCAAVQATLAVENNKHPNFEWRGGERGVDSFVLCSYPIWVHVDLNNFVTDCLNCKVTIHAKEN